MNILRMRRKSNRKISWKRYLLFVFTLIMTTFAWFAYSKVLNTTLNIHVASWNMRYYIEGVEKTNPIGIEIPTLYPTMEDQVIQIDIKNNGEALADLDYHVSEITIAGVTYELVTEGNTNTTDDYIDIETPVLDVDPETGEAVAKGKIINDLTRFPFVVEIEHSAQIQAGGDAYLTVTTKWAGDNDELDSEWGYVVGEYFLNNPSATTAMSLKLSIDSYQADEIILAGAGTLPSSAGTRPYLPSADYARVEGTDLDTGLIIEDSAGNEYVWIEVPKLLSIYQTAGINVTEFTDEEYVKIETDLKNYASDYRSGISGSDQYKSDTTTGLTSEQYTTLKNKMLKSVYENGGFYVAKYEAGADTYRTNHAAITGITPMSQANKYPINWITCAEAQQLATQVASGTRTSSLMFGIQWDLVLKYMEEKNISQSLLMSNSTTWGNYNSTTYNIANENVKFSLNNGSAWSPATSYNKTSAGKVLLTTGAAEKFEKQNIFDLAGNVWEWTLEYSGNEANSCTLRGGSYESTATENNANYRSNSYDTFSYYSVGFRVSIY